MRLSYSQLLKAAIEEKKITLNEISHEIEKLNGSRPAIEYLSRLKNNKISPASDKLNDALARVLHIDPLEFKTAAYREKIPLEILDKLENTINK